MPSLAASVSFPMPCEAAPSSGCGSGCGMTFRVLPGVEMPRIGLRLRHLVLDYNGTIALRGALLPGVAERLHRLCPLLEVHVITADTFGSARAALQAELARELETGAISVDILPASPPWRRADPAQGSAADMASSPGVRPGTPSVPESPGPEASASESSDPGASGPESSGRTAPLPSAPEKRGAEGRGAEATFAASSVIESSLSPLPEASASSVTPEWNEAVAKRDFLRSLGASACCAVGNGANDELMLREAALSIGIIGGEGAAWTALSASRIVVRDIREALDLLLEPRCCIATLRV